MRRRRIVIDADVARSAGPSGDSQSRPARCARFLESLRDICHLKVLTGALRKEWRSHRSGFFQEWRVSMWARGSHKVAETELRIDVTWREGILRTAATPADRAEMEKDLHLVEAALATDGIIVSCDEAARRRFAQAARTVRQLRNVVWVNPARMDGEAAREWLEAGAPPRDEWKLGYRPDE
jgi:hypothetical protein